MSRKLLISDLDNTLYNFIDYFAPSFRGMVHALSRTLSVPEPELISDFKQVFAKHGSVEYAFAVQELNYVKDFTDEEIVELIKTAKGAYSRVRQKNLVTYPNVKETLEWASVQGIIIVGVSNAPYFQALRRLKQLKIDKYFSGLVTWEGNQLIGDRFSTQIVNKELAGEYKSRVKKVWKLPKNKLKPNIDGYKLVLDYFGIDGPNCYILGDSISKDVNPASELGANGIWARYGEKVEQKNLDTVLSISNWDDKKKATIYFDKHIEPELIIDDFSELRSILTGTQLSFDF